MVAREVVTLNESTPQLEVPQSGDTYEMPRDVNITGNLAAVAATFTGDVDAGANSFHFTTTTFSPPTRIAVDLSSNGDILWQADADFRANLIAGINIRGFVETATQAEVDTGTDILRYVTPETFTDAGISMARAMKTADETVNNSTSLQNDDDLVVSMAANTRHHFRLTIFWNSAATPDYKCGWAVPTGATMKWQQTDSLATVISESGSLTLEGQGADAVTVITGFVKVLSTPGNLQFQFAQDSLEVSDTKTLEGSYLQLWRE